MSNTNNYNVTCTKCGYKYSARLKESFSIDDYGTEITNIRNENKVICPKCLNEEEFDHPLRCYSPKDGTIIQYTTSKKLAKKFIESMDRLCNRVSEFDKNFPFIMVTATWNDFIEKVISLKNGLDNRVIEIIKEKILYMSNEKMVLEISFDDVKNNELLFTMSFRHGYQKDKPCNVSMEYYENIKDKYFGENQPADEMRHYIIDYSYARRKIHHIPQLHPDKDYIDNDISIVGYVTFDNNDEHVEPFLSMAQIEYGTLVTVMKNGEQVVGKYVCMLRELEEDFPAREENEIKEVLIDKVDEKMVDTLINDIDNNAYIYFKDIDLSEEEFNKYQKNQILRVNMHQYFKYIHIDKTKNTRVYILTNYEFEFNTYQGVDFSIVGGGYYKVVDTYVEDGLQTIILIHLPHGAYYNFRNDLSPLFETKENEIIEKIKKSINNKKLKYKEMPEVEDKDYINDLEDFKDFAEPYDINELLPKISIKEE